MRPDDVERFADLVVKTIKGALGPVYARVEALEKREPILGRDGQPGRDGMPGRDADSAPVLALMAEVKALQGELVTLKSERAATTVPCLVENFEIEAMDSTKIAAFIEEHVAPLIRALPLARDGQDGKAGHDGTSVTAADVAPLIAAEVAKAVAAIPPAPAGKDGAPGASVDRSEVEVMVQKSVERSFAAQPPEITSEELAASFTTLLKQELGVLPVSPVQPMQKRILRDRSGKIERVIEEPATA